MKFEPANHRLDAGTTFSIAFEPFAQIRSYTLTVRVGLHPNAAQSYAELPRIKTIAQEFQADMEDGVFHWRDRSGKKWKSEDIVHTAIDRLTDLLASEH